MSDQLQLDPALVIAILAFMSGIYATYQSRKVRDADAASKIAGAASVLLDDLREQVISLGNRVKEQDHQIGIVHETLTKAMKRIDMLERENTMLKDANIELRKKYAPDDE